MTKKKQKRFKRSNYRRNVQDRVESDCYVKGRRNEKGELVMRPLTEEEAQFISDFEDGLYAKNHRDHEIFTEHPNYNKKVNPYKEEPVFMSKQELDKASNVINDDVYSVAKAAKSLKEFAPVLKMQILQEDRESEEARTVTEYFKYSNFEDTARKILLDTLGELKYADEKDVCLVRFYLKMRCLMRLVHKETTGAKK